VGIKTNLQVFLDPDYKNFDQEYASAVGASRDEAASAWNDAIMPELAILFAPMAPAQLIDLGSSMFVLQESDFDDDTLPGAIDDLMDDVAENMQDVSGQIQPPTTSLDSKNLIFDPNPPDGLSAQYTPEEICERAESVITAWLMTGTFTAHFYSPGPGVPATPWVLPPGAEMPVPPDTDEDGYDDAEEDAAGTDIEDPDEFPD